MDANAGYRASLEWWRDALIDYALVVDDKRAAVHRALDELREAEREQHRATRHLAQLIALPRSQRRAP